MRYRFAGRGLGCSRDTSRILRALGGYRRDLVARLQRLYAPPQHELFDVLEPWSSDAEWTGAVRTVLEERTAAGHRVRVDVCEYVPGPDGYLALAMSNHSLTATVVPDDEVCSGFAALRVPDGGLEVWPRMHRKVCANGEIEDAGTGAGMLAYAGSVERAAKLCLGSAPAEERVELYRRAALDRVGEPMRLLRELQETTRRQVLERFAREREPTRWNLANAVTAQGHLASDARERFELERIGARLLAAAHERVAHA